MPLRFACFCLILAFEALSLGAQESPPAAVPIDPIVLRPNVWESAPHGLEPDLKILGFEWISADQNVARSALPGLAFQKRPLDEVLFSFRDGKLTETRLFYFNRRDSGALREDRFQELLAGITPDLSSCSGRQPVNRGRDAGSAVKAEGRSWEADDTRYLLEWSVVASVERVVRYYGATVHQHELAQIANSDAAGGTSMDAMSASLRRLTARLGVKVRAFRAALSDRFGFQ